MRRLVEALRGRRVAVVGDVAVDVYLMGRPYKLSREAPVVVVRYQGEEMRPGAAANAANNLRSLGAEVRLLGVVGDDPEGRFLRERFPELFVAAGARTTSKLRILAGDEHTSKQQVIRIDRDPTVDPPNPFEEEMIRALRDEELEGVLASDYGYGLLTPRLVAELRELARRVPVVVDSHHRLAEFRGVTAITPNEAEASLASGVPIRSEADLREAGRRLLRRVAPQAVLITRGNRGMALFRPRRPPRLIPVHGPTEALDVTGAGDTVAAAFLLALASGASFEEAAELSNLAASVVVMKRGTATVSQAELMGLVDG